MRIWQDEGTDAARAIIIKLMGEPGVDHKKLREELIRRNLVDERTRFASDGTPIKSEN